MNLLGNWDGNDALLPNFNHLGVFPTVGAALDDDTDEAWDSELDTYSAKLEGGGTSTACDRTDGASGAGMLEATIRYQTSGYKFEHKIATYCLMTRPQI